MRLRTSRATIVPSSIFPGNRLSVAQPSECGRNQSSESGTPKSTAQSPVTAKCTSAKGGSQNIAPVSKPTSATPNWTVSASGGADIYNDEPSRAIPSASHLRTSRPARRSPAFGTYPPTARERSFGSVVLQAGRSQSRGSLLLPGPDKSIDPQRTSIQHHVQRAADNSLAGLRHARADQCWANPPWLWHRHEYRFPIAVSYSNRSDLIVHPFVGYSLGSATIYLANELKARLDRFQGIPRHRFQNLAVPDNSNVQVRSCLLNN